MKDYVGDLGSIVDLDAIRGAKLRLCVDTFGGAGVGSIGGALASTTTRLDLTVLHGAIDKTFRFMPLDHDGKIRTDCSSPYMMSGLVARKGSFDLAFANDADADRHGVVTNSSGFLFRRTTTSRSSSITSSRREPDGARRWPSERRW